MSSDGGRGIKNVKTTFSILHSDLIDNTDKTHTLTHILHKFNVLPPNIFESIYFI